MFPAGNNSAIAQPMNPLLAERDDFLRVGSERAITDYRIFRVRVDIQHRREIQVDSHRGEFCSGCAGDFVGELDVSGFAKTRSRRKVGERFGEPMNSSPFLIDGDERGQAFVGVPKSASQRKNLRRIAAIMAKENKATERIVFDRYTFFTGEFSSPYADQEHLGDFFS